MPSATLRALYEEHYPPERADDGLPYSLEDLLHQIHVSRRVGFTRERWLKIFELPPEFLDALEKEAGVQLDSH